MLSLVGGYVHWELAPDFPTSGNMTFYIYSAFDATEGLQASTGFITNVGQVVGVQTSGSFLRKDLLADKLGAIRFVPSQGVRLPSAGRMTNGDVVNDFVVSSVVGDIVSGRTAVPYTLPRDASNATVYLVTREGQRLSKGNGVLLSCNLLGISATPCSLFAPSGSTMDLETVFLRPPSGPALPLHSPRPRTSLHTVFSETSRSLPIIVVDYSGRNVSVYPLGSTSSFASQPDMLCRNSTGGEGPFLRDGCEDKTSFSPISSYAGARLLLRTDNKIIVKPKPKFYFSFALVLQAQTAEGAASYGYSTFQFCAEFVYDSIAALMPPDWALVSNGSAIRAQPPTQLRCIYLESCFADVCAAHFAVDAQQRPQVSGRATFIDVISSSADERFLDLQLQTLTAPAGVTCRRVLFGPNQGVFSLAFVSKIYTVCLRASSTNVVSPSNPLCISAKIISRPPRFAGSLALVPPPPMGIPPSASPNVLLINPGDRIPDQVVCLGTPINIVFSGYDDDDGDGSEGFLVEDLQGASSLFSPPLNAVQTKFYDSSSRVSQTMLSLLVGKSNGFTRDDYGLPLSPRARRLCFYLVDNTFALFGRYGDWPYNGYASPSSCFGLTFVGPPDFLGAFIGQLPQDLEWPPVDFALDFNLLSRNESTFPVLDVGLGRSVIISFLAADSNAFDSIAFLVREDPGLPSPTSSVLPVQCVPRKVFDPQFPGGFGVSPCSLAAVSVLWTVHLDQLPVSASDGNFSVPLCFIARDNSTSCSGTSPAATAAGWYSAPSCVRLRVALPVLSWIAPSMSPQPPYPVTSVGFDCTVQLFATVLNLAPAPSDLPLNVSLVGNATQLLVGNLQVTAKFERGQQSWDVAASLRVSASHQGLRFSACFDAESAGLPGGRQRVCADVVVRVCSVCTHPGGSLYAMAVRYYSSTNWQSLLRFNPVCSPERLCLGNSSSLPVSSDVAVSSSSGGITLPGLSLGDVVQGSAAAALARSSNSTETLVRRLNPARVEGTEGDWCIARDVREDE